MSPDIIEEQDELVPSEDPLEDTEALVELEDIDDAEVDADPFDLEAGFDEDELFLGTDEPPPQPGKSYAFDWDRQVFVRAGSDVVVARGRDTLIGRLNKTVRTPRGQANVHVDVVYGMEDPDREIGRQTTDVSAAAIEERYREALLPDPLVAEVTDFELDVEPDRDYADVSLTVILLEDTAESEESQELALELPTLPVS